MSSVRVFLAVALTMAASLSSADAEAQCVRWWNNLYEGEESFFNPGRKLPTALEQEESLARERFFWRVLLSDDPVDACKKEARYSSAGLLIPAVAYANDLGNGTANCFNDNVVVNGLQDPGEGTVTTVNFLQVPTESCCAFDSNDFPNPAHPVTPDKFYKTNPITMVVEEFDPAPGLSFQGSDVKFMGMLQISQKEQIRVPNQIAPNAFRSDLSGLKTLGIDVEHDDDRCKGPPGSGSPGGTLWYERGVSTHDECAAEVDHIIPRVEVHGCPCGSNSYKNAQLISRKLNNYLSNDCNPKRPAGRARLEIVNNYANGILPVPPTLPSYAEPGVRFTGSSPDADSVPAQLPIDDAETAAGCSVGPPRLRTAPLRAPLLVLAGLAIVSALRRRRDR